MDIVITTPNTLAKWNYTDQPCNSDKIFLLLNNLSNFQNQKFFK